MPPIEKTPKEKPTEEGEDKKVKVMKESFRKEETYNLTS
jgi:hypothetical protein